jgi:hypothetical protein
MKRRKLSYAIHRDSSVGHDEKVALAIDRQSGHVLEVPGSTYFNAGGSIHHYRIIRKIVDSDGDRIAMSE